MSLALRQESTEIIVDLLHADLTDFQPEPGKAYLNLPNEQYHGLKEWESSSTIKNIQRSLEYYDFKKNETSKPGLPLEKGSALHYAMELLAENDSLDGFDDTVMTFKGSTIPSKKYDEVKKEHPECIVVPEQVKKDVLVMAEKAYQKSNHLGLFNRDEGVSEMSIFWIDPITGIKCKARPDYMRFDVNLIIDYKTTKDNSETGYPKQVANYDYHLSAAFYIEAVKQVFGVNIIDFIHTAIASTAPFEVEFYALTENTILEGECKFRDSLAKLKANDRSITFKDVELPRWAFTNKDLINQY